MFVAILVVSFVSPFLSDTDFLVDFSKIENTGCFATTRAHARGNRDVVRRYLRAYVEALHRLKTELQRQSHAEGSLPDNQRNSDGDEIGSRDAKAKNLSPAALIDVHYLNELEQSGLIKKSYMASSQPGANHANE